MRVGSLKMAIFAYRSLSSEHFTYMATRQLSHDATVDDLGDISRSLNCSTSNFSKTVRDTAKNYYRPLTGTQCCQVMK